MQYDNGLSLPPGKYHLNFVVRENETGRMGSFEPIWFRNRTEWSDKETLC